MTSNLRGQIHIEELYKTDQNRIILGWTFNSISGKEDNFLSWMEKSILIDNILDTMSAINKWLNEIQTSLFASLPLLNFIFYDQI